MTATEPTANAVAAGKFIAAAKGQNFPAEVVDAARMCLVDTVGVGIGAHAEGAGEAVRRVAAKWATAGQAQLLLGGKAAPAAAALVNATLGHCLDYDDTHLGAVAHLSSPTWNTALAVGGDLGADERDILAAYIVGFETAARLGGGVGQTLNELGFHSTGVVGCLAAATTASVLMGLDETGIRNALGAAATQVSGLAGSFGTMSKPFHAGKAAMNGILAAELAAEGFVAAQDMLEADGPLIRTLIQDHGTTIRPFDPAGAWELTQNTFKPYASCLMTHPVLDATRKVAESLAGRDIAQVRVAVHPYNIQMAGKTAPTTGLEGKFSIPYCTAVGLNGGMGTAGDFLDAMVQDEAMQSLLRRVEMVPDDAKDVRAAHVVIDFADGGSLESDTPIALGNPENPMSWDDMRVKFDGLVAPVLGDAPCAELFDVLRGFDRGAMADYVRLVARD
ncbi:MAG: MmgE/PrpD family protein [Alphaproteobacteria bacterium]|nr:MmgE/PrpD family protein [Alphaproteobacteria bacterium]